ncbi:hypothetical protein EG861_00635 [Enterococcus faecalis]|nr:hypothetical protein [Enterococcus faecalis]EGO8523735.1 hypothetical protein [Enterococcus faecalis]EGO8849395.1 hypothetical protein [Enterococcus faecalis]EGO8851530.1 hypothetical protein [Enterococcus faecalis]EGO8879689.1 hypothetical protein [Enterococcus faecalis]
MEKEVEIEVGRFCEKMSQFKLFRTSFSVSFFQRMHYFKLDIRISIRLIEQDEV